MIYVIGDTHGNIDIHKVYELDKSLTKEDYIIQTGDWGAIWKEYDFEVGPTFKYWKSLPCEVFVVLGNHENYTAIETRPKVVKNGANCIQLADNIFSVERGEILELDQKKFFCFGGAFSTEKINRQPEISWWHREEPTYKEISHGLSKIESNPEVDYVISHTCPVSVIMEIVNGPIWLHQDRLDSTAVALDEFRFKLKFKNWFFGHFHIDKSITIDDQTFTCLYDKIVSLT